MDWLIRSILKRLRKRSFDLNKIPTRVWPTKEDFKDRSEGVFYFLNLSINDEWYSRTSFFEGVTNKNISHIIPSRSDNVLIDLGDTRSALKKALSENVGAYSSLDDSTSSPLIEIPYNYNLLEVVLKNSKLDFEDLMPNIKSETRKIMEKFGIEVSTKSIPYILALDSLVFEIDKKGKWVDIEGIDSDSFAAIEVSYLKNTKSVALGLEVEFFKWTSSRPLNSLYSTLYSAMRSCKSQQFRFIKSQSPESFNRYNPLRDRNLEKVPANPETYNFNVNITYEPVEQEKTKSPLAGGKLLIKKFPSYKKKIATTQG